MNRRRFLQLTGGTGLAAASGFILSSCGDNGETVDSSSTTIQFTWWGSTERHERTQRALDAFEQ
jgi:ABC-type glycerol-3-phosphate transport system substrate-binding protein